jgi:N-acetyl-gamma-glutamyl-phosphate reductase
MAGQRGAIADASRISNPGCYPTGFLALTRPLVDAGIVPRDALLSVPAVSGFSGGGNGMISQQADGALPVFGSYGVTLAHKHLPEMVAYAGLDNAPIFMPAVADFYSGMLVNLPLHAAQLTKSVTGQDLHDCLAAHFDGPGLVRMAAAKANDDALLANNLMAADGLVNADHMEISVFANPDNSQFWLLARLDNLGKGASGAAVQNMNIALGLDETMGLNPGA